MAIAIAIVNGSWGAIPNSIDRAVVPAAWAEEDAEAPKEEEAREVAVALAAAQSAPTSVTV